MQKCVTNEIRIQSNPVQSSAMVQEQVYKPEVQTYFGEETRGARDEKLLAGVHLLHGAQIGNCGLSLSAMCRMLVA